MAHDRQTEIVMGVGMAIAAGLLVMMFMVTGSGERACAKAGTRYVRTEGPYHFCVRPNGVVVGLQR